MISGASSGSQYILGSFQKFGRDSTSVRQLAQQKTEEEADQKSTVSVEKDDLNSFPTSCHARANAIIVGRVEEEAGMADGARVCSRGELASGTISESVNWTPG